MSSSNKLVLYGIRGVVVALYSIAILFMLYLPKIYEDYFFEDDSLNVYTFAEVIPSDAVRDFEEKYKVKVNIRYFDTNEDLFAKFKITRGLGYDVITASDYTIDLLTKEKLLHPLNHQKLPVIKSIDSRLLGHSFDRHNAYSLPLAWVIYGLVFRKDLFTGLPERVSLELIFKDPAAVGFSKKPYRICMPNDYREAILIASLYTTGQIKTFTDEQLKTVEKLLIHQKAWVESYLNQDLRYFFLSDIVQLAFCSSAYTKKLLRASDEFIFKIPREGSLLSIENFAITATSKKVDLAHQFINFMLLPENGLRMHHMYGYNPSNRDAYADLDERIVSNINFFPDDAVFATLHLIHNAIPLKKFEDIWLHVKAS